MQLIWFVLLLISVIRLNGISWSIRWLGLSHLHDDVNDFPLIQEFKNGTEIMKSIWHQFLSKVSPNELQNGDMSEIVRSSDIGVLNRTIWIVTTAALPWMTGTAINPLLRAAHLARLREYGKVFLMVPWLDLDQQATVFGSNFTFPTPDHQRVYIFKWLSDEAGMRDAAQKLQVEFYTGRYHEDFHSIFPMGDVCGAIPDDLADICILEEPEHLNWFKAPFTAKAWMEKFQHVIGIIHTNYMAYVKSEIIGHVTSPFIYIINKGMCRAYCHKIVKLSGALQEFAPEKEVVCNVHGVRDKYLKIGDMVLNTKFSKGAYFIGKLAWPKGLDDMFKLMHWLQKRAGVSFDVDIFGHGPHALEIQRTAYKMKLPVSFHGVQDHASLVDYKVFINPSTTEVLCTAIAEALAMGKWVVCPRISSNEFFEQFPNCLMYANEEQFAANVYWALYNDPHTLSKEQRFVLTWEAATERLIQASMITKGKLLESQQITDRFLAWALEKAQSNKYSDIIRFMLGGKSVSNQLEFMKKFGTSSPNV